MADHGEHVVPAKRTRPSDENVDVVERDPEVWMEDGNIVIEARNVAFKVYKGILAGRSEVFRDLFSVPSPAEVEAMDGVPIVHLQDSATDLKYLFLVLFCGKNFFTHLGAPIEVDFAVVAALVRLGHKYAITDVYEEAYARLSAHYAIHLYGWRRSLDGKSSLRTTPQDAMTVVELARLTNGAHLLPTALVVCTTLGTELITSNILAPDDLLRVIQGKAALVKAGAKLALASLHFLLDREDECSQENEEPLLTLMRNLESDGLMQLLDGLDPFASDPCSLLQLGHDDQYTSPCLDCQQSFLIEMDGLLRELWSDLPSMFGVVVEEWADADE